MAKVIFLNRYFFPDHSATSQVLSAIAFALAAAGHDVHVIASRQLYDEPNTCLPSDEMAKAVKIHRVRTTRFGRASLLGRSIDYISFFFSVRRTLSSVASANDIVIVKTDPPLLSLAVLSVVKRRRARLVNWLQDLYPEIAIASGMHWLKGPIGAGLSFLRDRSLKAACDNVVVGELMAERLGSRQVGRERIHFIPNFAVDDEIVPVAAADNPLRGAWGLGGKFVIGYSGNLGRVHEFQTIIDAAEHLRNDPRIVFLCVGGGRLFDLLARSIGERQLRHKFVFRPYQDRAALKYSLSAPDVHWISLRPEFEGLVVPSKVYGIAAAGRPIIAITAKCGEIARMVQTHRCGVVVAPGDAQALTATLKELMDDPSLCVEMGSRAREMLEQNYTRAHALRLWQQLLNSVRLR
jgi:glycosyltransferase involved in cell wall biosynthesis